MQRTSKFLLIRIIPVLFVFCLSAHAQVPQIINYQGRVAAGGINFDGAGLFKFALVSGSGTTTLWSNDGSSLGGNQPQGQITLPVSKGLYSVLLGDSTIPNMTVVPASVFMNSDVRLRVWFNDGTHGWQLLSPDQRIAAVGYAMVSASATVSGSAVLAGTALVSNSATISGSSSYASTSGLAAVSGVSGSTNDTRLATALQSVNSTSDSISVSSSGNQISISSPTMNLLHSYQMLYNMTNPSGASSTGTTFTWVTTGDSVGGFKPQYIIPILKNKFSDAGVALGACYYSASGNCHPVQNDWRHWVSGNVWYLSTSGTLTCSEIGTESVPSYFFGNILKIYFLTTGPQYNTFQVQYSTSTGASGGSTGAWTTGTAVVTTGRGAVLSTGTLVGTALFGGTVSAIATLNMGPTPAWYKVQAVGVSGTTVIIGGALINAACPGVMNADVCQGGSNLCCDQECGSTILNPIMYDLNPTVVSMEFKDSVAMWSGSDTADGLGGLSLATWQTLWTNACPNADFIDIGSTPPDSPNTSVNCIDQLGQNAMLQANAQLLGHFYFDSYTPCGSYDNIVKIFGANGVHPNPGCNQWLATLLLEKTGWLNFTPLEVTGQYAGYPLNGGNYNQIHFHPINTASNVEDFWMFDFANTNQGAICLNPLNYPAGNGEGLYITNSVKGWSISKPDGTGGINADSNGLYIGYDSASGVKFRDGNLYIQNSNGWVNTPNISVSQTYQDSMGSPGANGQVLTSTGSNTIWMTPSGGALNNPVLTGTGTFPGTNQTISFAPRIAITSLSDTNQNVISNEHALLSSQLTVASSTYNSSTSVPNAAMGSELDAFTINPWDAPDGGYLIGSESVVFTCGTFGMSPGAVPVSYFGINSVRTQQIQASQQLAAFCSYVGNQSTQSSGTTTLSQAIGFWAKSPICSPYQRIDNPIGLQIDPQNVPGSTTYGTGIRQSGTNDNNHFYGPLFIWNSVNIMAGSALALSGTVTDSTGWPGATGQVLVSTGSGVMWSTISSGSTGTPSGGTGDSVIVSGPFKDATGSTGLPGQILQSTGSSVVWTSGQSGTSTTVSSGTLSNPTLTGTGGNVQYQNCLLASSFGAVGDGVTDDTAALNAAWAAASKGCGALFLDGTAYACNLTGSTPCVIFGRGACNQAAWRYASGNDTRLVPFNNSQPIIHVQTLDNLVLKNVSIVGNGANTTQYGLAIYSGNSPTPGQFPGAGLILENCWIGNCAYPVYNSGGCNIHIKNCAMIGGKVDYMTGTSWLSCSEVIEMCSLGGNPASGSGRLVEINDTGTLLFENNECGNCTDGIVLGPAFANVNIVGGNWESFSGTGALFTVNSGKLQIDGGRFSLGAMNSTSAALVRYTGYSYSWISLHNINGAKGNNMVYECPAYCNNMSANFSYYIDVSVGGYTPWYQWYSDNSFTTVTGSNCFDAGIPPEQIQHYSGAVIGTTAANGGNAATQYDSGVGKSEMSIDSTIGSRAVEQYTAFANTYSASGASLNWGLPFVVQFTVQPPASIADAHTGCGFCIGGSGVSVTGGAWAAGTNLTPSTANAASFIVSNGTATLYTGDGSTLSSASSAPFVTANSNDTKLIRIINSNGILTYLYRDTSGGQWYEMASIPNPSGSTFGNCQFILANDGTAPSPACVWDVFGDLQIINSFPH